MNLNRRSFIFGTTITLLCITGCNTGVLINREEKELDTTKLQSLIDQLKVDLDKYEMDSDMRAYSSRVSKAISLLANGNPTQDEIDNAVEEITELRKVVTDKDSPHDATTLTGINYESFVNSAQENTGNTYHVEGYATRTSGGFRGSDYQVYIWWDESKTQNEVSHVCIPYKAYKKSVSKYFSGNCVFQGLDENGHPFFLCDTKYEAE